MLLRKVAVLLLYLTFVIPVLVIGATKDVQAETTLKPSDPVLKFQKHFAQSTLTDATLQDAISSIDKTAQKLVDDKVVPGLAIAIVYKDKVAFAKGFGVRQVGNLEEVNADTVFQLASVSKSLASTVVAALIGDGKITWDSRLSDLDPTFEMPIPWVSREITLRDFFCHRSGLPDHAGDILEDIGYGRAEILYRLRFQKPVSSFRSKYAYTNFGLTEAGVAAARSVNKTWEDLSDEKLYKPLGMKSTSSRYSDFHLQANKALGHVLVDGKWVQKYQRDPDAQSPAGGASSSVNDLAKWMILQIAKGKFKEAQIVQSTALEETHRPHMMTQYSPISGLPEFYGLGFGVSYDQSGRLRLGHSGAFSRGASTAFTMVPSEGVGICVLTNAYPIGVSEGLTSTFIDLALNGKPSQDWFPLYKQIFSDPALLGVSDGSAYKTAKVSARAALKNEAYVGKYQNDFFGELEIRNLNDGLAMVVGVNNPPYPLKHFDGDTFIYHADSEDLSGSSGLRFSVAPDGSADSVLVENFDEDGQGSFKRVKK